MVNLKFQKLDRRMSGHGFFTHKVEFPKASVESYNKTDAVVLFLEAAQHMTRELGFGPPLEEISRFTFNIGEAPWAIRCSGKDAYTVNTLYVREGTSKDALEKFIVIKQLQG